MRLLSALAILALTLLALTLLALAPPAAAEDKDPPYVCQTGDNYMPFEADFDGVTQVCPAHANNYSTTGLQTTGEFYVVIHCTGNASATAIQGNINMFQKSTWLASAHYLVGLNDAGGADVIQMVSEAHMAYHVGDVVKLAGNEITNANSIGIEVVGQGDLEGWPSEAVRLKVADLVDDIISRAEAAGRTTGRDRVHIVGHEEIRTPPGERWDPGPPWNWQQFVAEDLYGEYTPAATVLAQRDTTSNKVDLKVQARYNGRTAYVVEASYDEAPYAPLEERKPQPGKPKTGDPNPATYDLLTYTPPEVDRPVEICYRAVAYHGALAYVNPSAPGCIVHGLAGQLYDLPRRDALIMAQGDYPLVGPGDAVRLQFTLRNAGILSWKPGGQYALFQTGGETFGLQTPLPVPRQILAFDEITWELPFTAPATAGAYTTRWRMGYVDKDSHEVQLFGPEAGFLVTVLPKGASPNVRAIIEQIIRDAVKTHVEQPLQQFLEDLQRRVNAEIEKQLRSICPCLPSLAPGVLAGLAVLWARSRNGR